MGARIQTYTLAKVWDGHVAIKINQTTTQRTSIFYAMSAPVPVNATKGTESHTFPSYGATARFILETEKPEHIRVDASTIKRYVNNGMTLCGWTLTRASPIEQHAATEPQPISDPMAFVFGEEAAEVFRGKSVRVTPDKRVSVYDVMRVVTGVVNASDAFSRLCTTHTEFIGKTEEYMFPRAAGRPTPVTDMQGMIELINLLPGANAARFRAGGAKLLVRYLGGDESLVDEVRAIAQHHGTGQSNGSLIGLLQAPQPPPHKYAFLSPSMAGRDLHEFGGKEVCYLLVFTHEGAQYIKFGRTGDPFKRMTEHMREIPGCVMYSMHETPHTAKRIEDEFRKKMYYRGHMRELVVRGKKQTEVLAGIGPEEAEQVMHGLIELGSYSCEENGQNKRFRLEADLRRKELDVEVVRTHAKVKLVTSALEKLNEALPAELVSQILAVAKDI